jgi:hypothetical protein
MGSRRGRLATITMKTYIYYLIFFTGILLKCAATEGIGTNAWGPINSNLQMSISVKGGTNEIKTNQPLILLVRIRNLSTNENYYYERYGDGLVDSVTNFVVTSPSGKDILPLYLSISRHPARFETVLAGKTLEYDFVLTFEYKFDELGVYKIIANKTLTLPGSNESVTVTAAPLFITVLPGKWQAPPSDKLPGPFGGMQFGNSNN